jgi:hypothetical protein
MQQMAEVTPIAGCSESFVSCYLASALDTQALTTPELQQSPTFTICSPSCSAPRAMPHTLPQDAACARRGWQGAKAFVTQHLARHELSATIVAAHLGVTPRYVDMKWPGRARP